jgi:hypothetical protein
MQLYSEERNSEPPDKDETWVKLTDPRQERWQFGSYDFPESKVKDEVD